MLPWSFLCLLNALSLYDMPTAAAAAAALPVVLLLLVQRSDEYPFDRTSLDDVFLDLSREFAAIIELDDESVLGAVPPDKVGVFCMAP
jgi:hypothetical protein